MKKDKCPCLLINVVCDVSYPSLLQIVLWPTLKILGGKWSVVSHQCCSRTYRWASWSHIIWNKIPKGWTLQRDYCVILCCIVYHRHKVECVVCHNTFMKLCEGWGGLGWVGGWGGLGLGISRRGAKPKQPHAVLKMLQIFEVLANCFLTVTGILQIFGYHRSVSWLVNVGKYQIRMTVWWRTICFAVAWRKRK